MPDKNRIGKKIYEQSKNISKAEGWSIKGYCVYQHIPDNVDISYKAGDNNKSIIMMWKKTQDGWKPPKTVNEKRYNQLKYGPDSAEKGYAGHQYGFGGKYFKGYFPPKYGKNNNSSDSVVKIAKKLKLNSVSFSNGLYNQYNDLKDPPVEKHNVRESFNKKTSSNGVDICQIII